VPRRRYGVKRNNSLVDDLGQKDGFQSDLERAVSVANGNIQHSSEKLWYIKHYLPDFVLWSCGDGDWYDSKTICPNPPIEALVIEVKGFFGGKDQVKMNQVIKNLEQIREAWGLKRLRIAMLFHDPSARTTGNHPTLYSKWCEKKGVLWAQAPYIPDEWLDTDLIREDPQCLQSSSRLM
jgi:hypothetical protein